MKTLIEKELCNPVNGKIVGPYYHLYKIDNDNNKVLIKTFEGDDGIIDAAREAERQLDLNEIEVAYQRNPDLFKATFPSPFNK